MPERIQLRRTKGWRKPAGAVVVARPSKWGNPYVVHKHTEACYNARRAAYYTCPSSLARETHAIAVAAFQHLFAYPRSSDPRYPGLDEIRSELAGRTLGCWCPLDQPCHADVLLELANSSPSQAVPA